MADINAVATGFTQAYYGNFDTNRAALGPFYTENSMLTWNGDAVAGSAKIGEKLESLSFKTVRHAPETTDAQPTMGGGLMIVVCGRLFADEDPANPPHPESPQAMGFQFTDIFHLVPTEDASSYWILNHVFRLSM